MTVAYASVDDLVAFLDVTDDWDARGAERLLERASELIDAHVRAWFDVDLDTQLATDTPVREALRDATCAQIEYWYEVGEEHDIEGLAGTQVSVMSLAMSHLPPELAPRAQRFLDSQSLRTLTPRLPLYTAAFI